jgi:hypothetical protein
MILPQVAIQNQNISFWMVDHVLIEIILKKRTILLWNLLEVSDEIS